MLRACIAVWPEDCSCRSSSLPTVGVSSTTSRLAKRLTLSAGEGPPLMATSMVRLALRDRT